MKAMFPELNRMVDQIIADREIEYVLTDSQFLTFESITEYYCKNSKFIIWRGGSNNTIFGTPEMNHKFRAWHDYHHIIHNIPFTSEGEYRVYMHQIDDINPYCDTIDKFKRCCNILDIEINGQVKYFEQHEYFPEDQRAFMRKQLAIGDYQCLDLKAIKLLP